MLRLLVTATVVPSSQKLVALMMQELNSSETSFLQEPQVVTFQKTVFYIVKQIPWPLVRKRTIPTERRHLSTKFSVNFCG
jgi:hypothetical protein